MQKICFCLLAKSLMMSAEPNIRNLNTIDLQAVPGSDKTTVLLAKFPFVDGSGVLVLSHTNAAIDEIKDNVLSRATNNFIDAELEIEVMPVHSAKGQTHATTLYLESCC